MRIEVFSLVGVVKRFDYFFVELVGVDFSFFFHPLFCCFSRKP